MPCKAGRRKVRRAKSVLRKRYTNGYSKSEKRYYRKALGEERRKIRYHKSGRRG